MLTNAAVKAARPQARAYKMFDERGLHLFVAPTGLRAWRVKYRFAGREKLLSIGRYPEMDLGAARARCDEARELLARGRDPAAGDQAAGAGEDLESVARAWHKHRRPRWTEVHAGDVLASLERDVFPAMGKKPIGAIDATAVLEVIQAIEARGCHETARRVRQRIDNIFGFAIARQMVASNPAALVAGELAASPIGAQHHPALLELDDARALLRAAEQLEAPAIVKLASLFLALTAVRMAALRGARWDEIEDIDGAAPLWRVPAERMKLAKAKKADPGQAHLVPLCAAAVAALREIRSENGYDTRSPLIFAHGGRAIAAGAIGALYRRGGYGGRHVPHGWRATFSTILNERFPEDRAVIDRALAHVPKDKVEAAYNRAEQLDRRRALFDRWGEMLIS